VAPVTRIGTSGAGCSAMASAALPAPIPGPASPPRCSPLRPVHRLTIRGAHRLHQRPAQLPRAGQHSQRIPTPLATRQLGQLVAELLAVARSLSYRKQSHWHCCIEAKSVLAMHQAGRQDPLRPLETPINRTSEGLSHGFWGASGAGRVSRSLNATVPLLPWGPADTYRPPADCWRQGSKPRNR
jgi:hypothetical protein